MGGIGKMLGWLPRNQQCVGAVPGCYVHGPLLFLSISFLPFHFYNQQLRLRGGCLWQAGVFCRCICTLALLENLAALGFWPLPQATFHSAHLFVCFFFVFYQIRCRGCRLQFCLRRIRSSKVGYSLSPSDWLNWQRCLLQIIKETIRTGAFKLCSACKNNRKSVCGDWLADLAHLSAQSRI